MIALRAGTILCRYLKLRVCSRKNNQVRKRRTRVSPDVPVNGVITVMQRLPPSSNPGHVDLT